MTPLTTAQPVPAYVTVPHAARLAQVSRRAVYRWITKGHVQTIRIPSGRLRVVTASLLQGKEKHP